MLRGEEMADKQSVHDFWNAAACGEELLLPGRERASYEEQLRRRYELEPFIERFARFSDSRGLKVLEIGVGLGADHQRYAECGARLSGIDLTERAIEHTKRRLDLFGLSSELQVGDAESLPFPPERFDVVYSWGVLHHSPDTQRAVEEVWRVLRPGGVARVMIYSKWSLVGLMLWTRYGLLALHPFRPMAEIYSGYLESPGTKAYTRDGARRLFRAFESVEIETTLTHGDLLASGAGQRHQGFVLDLARALWPRWLIRRVFPRMGLFMMITARKQGVGTG
jgi:SAM-dependent methyltransferase